MAPNIGNRVEVVAHGGTALTLRGLKGNTKDLDINIIKKEWFEEICRTLEVMGYKKKFDFMAKPESEHNIRYISDRYIVDTVDLYHPTWNNWSITDTVERRADNLKFGNLTVVLPDIETVFLFKTYPNREIDIEDLRSIILKNTLDANSVIGLFREQESILRTRKDIDPVISIVNLRSRFYLSISDLKRLCDDKRIGILYNFASVEFNGLHINLGHDELAGMIRSQGKELGLEWETFIHSNHKEFAKALGIH